METFLVLKFLFYIFQFSSVTQSCLTLCDPMDCNIPGLHVHWQLPEFTQTHVHWVSDAIQPSYPLSSPSPAFNLSQYQGLLKRVSSLHLVAIYLIDIFNWKCCVSFRCIAKWLSYASYLLFFKFFSHLGYYRVLNIILCAISSWKRMK